MSPDGVANRLEARDLAAERAPLTEAGGPEYAKVVTARVDGSDYGESWKWCTMATLWAGIERQAVDLAGYSVILARRAEQDGVDSERLRALLVLIGRHGAQASALIVQARRLIETDPAVRS